MNEDVGAGSAGVGNETETLLVVEPFDYSLGHADGAGFWRGTLRPLRYMVEGCRLVKCLLEKITGRVILKPSRKGGPDRRLQPPHAFSSVSSSVS
jgi:hypothetical protein